MATGGEVEGKRGDIGSEDLDDLKCQPCQDDGELREAVGLCTDCQEYLCQRCFDGHRLPRPTRDHQLLDKQQMLQSHIQLTRKDRCSERCPLHNDEIVKYYCSTHGQLGCSDCLNINHRTCTSVLYIPDVACDLANNVEFQNVEEQVVSVLSMSKSITERSKQTSTAFEESYSKAMGMVDDFQKEMTDVIDNNTTSMREEVNNLRSFAIQRMNVVTDKGEAVAREVQSTLTKVETFRKSKQNCNLFIEMMNVKGKIGSLDDQLKEIATEQPSTKSRIYFVPNMNVLETMQQSQSFGSLSLTGNEEQTDVIRGTTESSDTRRVAKAVHSNEQAGARHVTTESADTHTGRPNGVHSHEQAGARHETTESSDTHRPKGVHSHEQAGARHETTESPGTHRPKGVHSHEQVGARHETTESSNTHRPKGVHSHEQAGGRHEATESPGTHRPKGVHSHEQAGARHEATESSDTRMVKYSYKHADVLRNVKLRFKAAYTSYKPWVPPRRRTITDASDTRWFNSPSHERARETHKTAPSDTQRAHSCERVNVTRWAKEAPDTQRAHSSERVNVTHCTTEASDTRMVGSRDLDGGESRSFTMARRFFNGLQSREFYVKSTYDQNDCWFSGSVFLSRNRLILTDRNNASIKEVDVFQCRFLRQLKLSSTPENVAAIDKNKVAVTIPGEEKVVLVKIGVRMAVVRDIALGGQCYGIAYKDGKLAVSFLYPTKIHVFDLTGTLLYKTSEQKKCQDVLCHPYYLSFDPAGTKLYVSNYFNHTVVCLDLDGDVIATYTDKKLEFPCKVVVDGRGSVFVCGSVSNNVHQLTPDCKKTRVLLGKADGLQVPYTVDNIESEEEVVVGGRNNVIKIFSK